MRYKTIIEIVSDAEDKNEAMEIVGEYLSGNIVSGVEMRCNSKPAYNSSRNIIAVVVAILVVSICAITAIHLKPAQNFNLNTPGTSAIQPPLKASATDKNNNKFKKVWQTRQTQEALNYIKR